MGAFDVVHVHGDARFVCPAGHPMGAQTFQTKDLLQLYRRADIRDGRATYDGGEMFAPLVVVRSFEIYESCSACQSSRGPLITFEIEIANGHVLAVTRKA